MFSKLARVCGCYNRFGFVFFARKLIEIKKKLFFLSSLLDQVQAYDVNVEFVIVQW